MSIRIRVGIINDVIRFLIQHYEPKIALSYYYRTKLQIGKFRLPGGNFSENRNFERSIIQDKQYFIRKIVRTGSNFGTDTRIHN